MARHWKSASRLVGVAVTAAAVLLAGCAAIDQLSADVSSFGDWPAARQPGRYAFERLPSQQARAEETAVLEDAARDALAKAGFTPVGDGATPDVLVQVGARTTLSNLQPWDDPLWWHGGFGYWRGGPWMSPRWALSSTYAPPRYDREVAVLIRDRASGKPLYESRASSEGNSRLSRPVLAAMFEAALVDFPQLGVNPRRVQVTLPGAGL